MRSSEIRTRARCQLVAAHAAIWSVVAACLVWQPALPVSILLGVAGVVVLVRVCLAPARPTSPPRRHPMDAIAREVERSRRYARCCSLVRVAGAAEHTNSSARRTDEAWDVEGDLMLLMPETAGTSARLAVSRLVGVPAAERAAVATFPDDALTVHGLLAAICLPIVAPDETAPAAPPAVGQVEVQVEVG